MKTKLKYFLIIMALGILTFACIVEPIGQQPLEGTPPGPVADVVVKNTPGGAILTYKLPADEDLLYVKATFTLKDGVPSEVRSSMYTDTLKIAGFGDTTPREVTIVAVDRSRNESSPVKVTINPLEPPVISIYNSLDLEADFGGVRAYWSNPGRAEVSIVILKEDNNKEYVPIETFYTSVAEGDGAKRGMDTIPGNFAIYAQDRWENRSEMKKFTLTPIYETQFDRLKFKAVILPNDEKAAWGWVLTRLFDGNKNSGFHTGNGTGRWPHAFTVDLGISGRVSRIKTYQRPGTWLYNHGNLKKFEVYGCETLDASGSWDNWTLLMTCNSIKPSGLPTGQVSNEDVAWASAGEEFINSPKNPKIRYLRIKGIQSWSDGDFLHMMELEVFGDNR